MLQMRECGAGDFFLKVRGAFCNVPVQLGIGRSSLFGNGRGFLRGSC